MTPTDAKRPLQLNDQGQLRHFLSLDGLSRDLLTEILDTADSFLEVGARAVKKVPLLRGKTVCNVFFENSTRTRTTFEMAAQRLSADVITLNVSTSSASKGETLLDTLRNLEAMATPLPAAPMYGFSPPPTSTSRTWCVTDASAKTCCTA